MPNMRGVEAFLPDLSLPRRSGNKAAELLLSLTCLVSSAAASPCAEGKAPFPSLGIGRASGVTPGQGHHSISLAPMGTKQFETDPVSLSFSFRMTSCLFSSCFCVYHIPSQSRAYGLSQPWDSSLQAVQEWHRLCFSHHRVVTLENSFPKRSQGNVMVKSIVYQLILFRNSIFFKFCFFRRSPVSLHKTTGNHIWLAVENS